MVSGSSASFVVSVVTGSSRARLDWTGEYLGGIATLQLLVDALHSNRVFITYEFWIQIDLEGIRQWLNLALLM